MPGAYFLDSSAIVKRYTPEQGHGWMAALCRTSARSHLYIAQTALVEVVASFCRMVRERPPRLSPANRDVLITRFRRHIWSQYDVVPVDDMMFTRAADLCLAHPLRAYDAVQLACALAVRDAALAAGVAPPTFVCSDAVLLGVAAAEGLATENPSAHP